MFEIIKANVTPQEATALYPKTPSNTHNYKPDKLSTKTSSIY